MGVSWVRVRALGEFVYCPRAGVLAHTSADKEDEPTDERMNLTFLPQYSLARIEEELALQLKRLFQWTAGVVGLLALVALAWPTGRPPLVPLALLLPLVLCVRNAVRSLGAVVTLNDRRREARAAVPTEPPTDLRADLRVRWWELLSAGFESVAYPEPLSDPDLALVGQPWRVLKKGSLRIPVIRLPADNYFAGRFWVYDSHRVRLAAYAHLLAACEGGLTPYAVVLFGGSHEGVAIPITPASLDGMRATLSQLRQRLDAEACGVPTPVPDNRSVCSRCPFGRPQPVTSADREREQLGHRLHPAPAPDGRTYHSPCGDRYRWLPPHEDTQQKRLG